MTPGPCGATFHALDSKSYRNVWELWALRHLGTGLATAGCDFGEYSSGKKKKSTKLAGGIQDNALPRFPREKMAATVNSECREPFPQKFVVAKNRLRSTLDIWEPGENATQMLFRDFRAKKWARP